MMQLEGRILKGISGFYEVEADGQLHTCKARGVFRKQGITPLPGDMVRITPGENGKEGTVEEIFARRNFLSRPPVSNIDRLFVVVSVCAPNPNPLVIDRLTAIAAHKQIEPLIVVTKSDLADPEPILKIYRSAGFTTFCISPESPGDVDAIRSSLCGKVSAFTGNSGVGKSTLPCISKRRRSAANSAEDGIPPAMWSCTEPAAAMWRTRPDFRRWILKRASLFTRTTCSIASGNLNPFSVNAGSPPAPIPATADAVFYRRCRRGIFLSPATQAM